MKILRTVYFVMDGVEEVIQFGIPNTPEELEQMYLLRYNEYFNRKYIQGEEKDEYDNKCTHFVVVWRNKMIGTIRLIHDIPLPTQKVFEFDEPKAISLIPEENRVELGRFVIIPLDKDSKKFAPKGLIMLVMFDVLFEFCEKNNFLGGYSFVKTSLYKKLKRLRVPIYDIIKYRQNYPENGVLKNYFTQENDKVIPIAFIVKEYKKYLKRIISNRLLFKKTGNEIKMKDNVIVRFLKFINII